MYFRLKENDPQGNMRDVRRNGELKTYWLNKITVAATITTAFNLSGAKMQVELKYSTIIGCKFGEGYQCYSF